MNKTIARKTIFALMLAGLVTGAQASVIKKTGLDALDQITSMSKNFVDTVAAKAGYADPAESQRIAQKISDAINGISGNQATEAKLRALLDDEAFAILSKNMDELTKDDLETLTGSLSQTAGKLGKGLTCSSACGLDEAADGVKVTLRALNKTAKKVLKSVSSSKTSNVVNSAGSYLSKSDKSALIAKASSGDVSLQNEIKTAVKMLTQATSSSTKEDRALAKAILTFIKDDNGQTHLADTKLYILLMDEGVSPALKQKMTKELNNLSSGKMSYAKKREALIGKLEARAKADPSLEDDLAYMKKNDCFGIFGK